jgi:hypothetical protein
MFAVVMVLAPLVYAGPQLVSDVKVGKDWTIAEDLAIKQSNCTRWYFLVSTCDIAYVNRRDPGRVGGTLSYLVFGSWAGERAMLLRSTTDPSRIGTTLGLEHMRQRLISFTVFAVLVFALLVGLVRLWVGAVQSNETVAPSVAVSPPPSTSAGARSFGRRSGGSTA